MTPLDSSTDTPSASTRPYLIRALHDWCTDNGYTPYLAVYVDSSVRVPLEYVKNNEIVLNVGFEATSGLRLGNDTIEFKARFGGTAREIMVPVDHVIAIYARENGQGMAFPVPTLAGEEGAQDAAERAPHDTIEPGDAAPVGLRLASPPATESEDEPPPGPGPGPGPASPLRPALKRVK